MQIQLNGEMQDVRDDMSIAELVEELGFAGRRIAVEVNLEIIPRSFHAQHRLQSGDKVEVVQAIGGGAYLMDKKENINE